MRHGKSKILHPFCHISNALHHIIFFFICHNPYLSVLILKKINRLHRKADDPLSRMKIKNHCFIRTLCIPKNFFQYICNFFFVYRFQKILKCMNSKGPCHIISVGRHIHNFYIPVYKTDGLSCINTIHSLHIDIKKNRVIRQIIFQQILSGRKHLYLYF